MDLIGKCAKFPSLIVPQNVVAAKWFGKDFAKIL